MSLDSAMKRLFPTLLLLIAVSATAAAPSPMESVARRFLINFAANRLDAAANDFNEEMRATVTPEVLANFKAQFDRDLGHFLSVTSAHERSEGAFPMIELTARFEKASELVQVTFDEAGRIGALHFGPVPRNNPELELVARKVLDAFNSRRFEELAKYFDLKMSAELTPSALESLYDDVTKLYGKFKSLTKVEYTAQRDLRVVKIFAEYEKMPMLFEVVFNNSGRVAGWSFRPPK